MKLPKFIVIIFFLDGTHERHEQDCGLGIDTEKVDDIRYIYIATGKRDADFALDHYTKKFAQYDKELEEMA